MGADGIFAEIGIVISVAALFAVVARHLRLPLLVGYVAAGVSLAPFVSSLAPDPHLVEGMRSIGLALLLFLVGIELDWRKAWPQLRAAGPVGLIQLAASFAVGLALAAVAGLPPLTGLYLGLALSFSSTVVATTLLSENGELNALHGRLSVSILLIQDLLSIAALTFLAGMGTGRLSWPEQAALLAVKLAAVGTITWVLTRHVLPELFRRIARSPELLFLCSLAWCFAFALAMDRLGFPVEIGAFLAGISLGSLPYGLEVINRVRTLRDFFVITLFFALGYTLVVPDVAGAALTAVLALGTLLVRPLISFAVLSAHGYRSRTAFLVSLTQGQLSEFSLVITAIALGRGVMDVQTASALEAAALISILISTVAYGRRRWLYGRLRPLLRLADRSAARVGEAPEAEESLQGHVIIVGYHRMGFHILKELLALKQPTVVIDFDPDVVAKLAKAGIRSVYGDAEDPQVLEAAGLREAALVVSTIPRLEETRFLIENVRRHRSRAALIVTAHTAEQALEYYQAGADYVILPYMLGGEHVGELLRHHRARTLPGFIKHRAEELKLQRNRASALYYE